MTELTYEEIIAKIEALINKMENGELPLEQSLLAFEEGMALIQAAKSKLDVYRQKVDATISELQP